MVPRLFEMNTKYTMVQPAQLTGNVSWTYSNVNRTFIYSYQDFNNSGKTVAQKL